MYINPKGNRGMTLLPDTFHGLAGSPLRQLVLANCDLDQLSADQFDGLRQLTTLNVHDNRLTVLQVGTFRHLTSLRSLYIQVSV